MCLLNNGFHHNHTNVQMLILNHNAEAYLITPGEGEHYVLRFCCEVTTLWDSISGIVLNIMDNLCLVVW